MDKYNFISIGQKVWADIYEYGQNKTLMQVCTNVRGNIKDDTKVNLIMLSEEKMPEEILEAFSYRADELTPYIKPFDQGYWCALQDAVSNDVNNSTIIQMIKTAGFTYWDCYYLMKDSDFESERLKNIVHSMFCQCPGLMLWEGKDYPTKVVTLFAGTENEETVKVATASFEKLLMNQDGNCKNEEAVCIDNQIFYYMNDEEFNYPDKDIIEILEDVLK